MTARWIDSTARWWTRVLTGPVERRKSVARALAELPVSAVLSSSSHELTLLGLTAREVKRLRAMESLVLRSRFERHLDTPLKTPLEASQLLIDELWGETIEYFVVAVLNVHHQAVLVERVHRGSVDRCTVDPREVFRPALLARGSAVLIGHNHPGGDPTPSQSDRRLTERLCAAGRAVSVPVLDHIVVAGIDRPAWYSFAEHNTMPDTEWLQWFEEIDE
ncbi:MAG: JAB domain-containing protein [Myxococcota bacterium]